jgi:hypothetical protein
VIAFLARLFSCRHQHMSFPQTPPKGKPRPAASTLTGYYVVCTDCGQEFPYDWENMRVIEDERKHPREQFTVAERSAL